MPTGCVQKTALEEIMTKEITLWWRKLQNSRSSAAEHLKTIASIFLPQIKTRCSKSPAIENL